MSISVLRRTALVVLMAASSLALAQSATKKEIVIGATAGSNIDVLKRGIQPQLEKTR